MFMIRMKFFVVLLLVSFLSAFGKVENVAESDMVQGISQWKRVVDNCRDERNSRCATALSQLAYYQFQLEELRFVRSGSEGQTDHHESLELFVEYIEKYPSEAKTPVMMYQAAAIYELGGNVDEAFKLRSRLVASFPKNGLAPKAWLRIAEYHFAQRNFKEAIAAYKAIAGFDSMSGKEAALALFHLAEAFYEVGKYEDAAKSYFSYIVGADNEKYPDDLRKEAMDFMVASFAKLEDGGLYEAKIFLNDKRVAFKDSVYKRLSDRRKVDSSGFLLQEGHSYFSKKQYASAIPLFEEYLRMNRTLSWDLFLVHVYLAYSYMENKQYHNAAKMYNWIADVDISKLGTRPQGADYAFKKEDAAYNAVLMMDKVREEAQKNKAKNDPVKAYKLAETKAYFDQVDRYFAKYENESSAAELAYNAAVVHYEARNFGVAVVSLRKLKEKFPNHTYILLIRKMYALSLAELGMLNEAYAELEWLYDQYTVVDETKNDSLANLISIAMGYVSGIIDGASGSQKVKALQRDPEKQTFVAVVETIGDDNIIDFNSRLFLTDRLREIASETLPAVQKYVIMTRENITQMLPPGKSIEECAGSCLAETGRNIAADFISQARIGKFGSNFTLTVELYETRSANLVGSFTAKGETLDALMDAINSKAEPMFKRILYH